MFGKHTGNEGIPLLTARRILSSLQKDVGFVKEENRVPPGAVVQEAFQSDLKLGWPVVLVELVEAAWQ